MIAEDEVLWYRLCRQEGHLPHSRFSDYTCWKLILQECLAKEHTLRANWKVGSGWWHPQRQAGRQAGLQLRPEAHSQSGGGRHAEQPQVLWTLLISASALALPLSQP